MKLKTVFLRAGAMLILILCQFSFIDILFPGLESPVLLIAAIVAYARQFAFPLSLMATLPLGFLSDVIAYGIPGWFSLYTVVLTYTTSFLSRRLLLEHPNLGAGLYACVTIGGILMYRVIVSVWQWRSGTEFSFEDTLVLGPTLGAAVLGALLFMLISVSLDRFEIRLRTASVVTMR